MTPRAPLERKVIEAMAELGFNATDARIYLALAKKSPATGYELAARSGVPRSAIYGALRRLEVLGLVNAIHESPARYIALPPARLFEMLESRFTRNLAELKGSLDKLVHETPDAATWTLHGYGAMLEQAEALVSRARRTVHASLWRREALALESALRGAVERGVDVVLFSWTVIPEELGEVLSYGVDESRLEQHWPHGIILVCDHARVLVGTAEQSEESRAVVTEERAIVDMAISNLVLDITLLGQRGVKRTAAADKPVGEIVARLTTHLAPVEDLIADSGDAKPRPKR